MNTETISHQNAFTYPVRILASGRVQENWRVRRVGYAPLGEAIYTSPRHTAAVLSVFNSEKQTNVSSNVPKSRFQPYLLIAGGDPYVELVPFSVFILQAKVMLISQMINSSGQMVELEDNFFSRSLQQATVDK